MGKKNEFISTIGFNRNDPNHVKVAKLLNSMSRGKAQYIVNAVLAYQDMKKSSNSCSLNRMDYDQVRELILQVIDERERGETSDATEKEDISINREKPEYFDNLLSCCTEDTLKGIRDSLEAFKR